MKPHHAIQSIVRASSTLALLVLAMATASAEPISNPGAYPLDTCIVSGEVVGEEGDIITKKYDDREVRFCCKSCVKDFEKDKASYLQKLDLEIISAQLPDYPLDTCIVSGEALGGEMGDPVDYVIANRLVRLCCNSCKKDLGAAPATYLEKLDAAVVESQLKDYPADTCPISGQKLGSMGDPYNYVFAGSLVRFCCGGCIGQFDADPQAAMATVYGDAGPKTSEEHDHSGHQH